MRVPDDVTLLWCDDNWGNIRRLPTAEERQRSGGAGIYYHFDYVGGPRIYKWLNTIPITKVWEQMNLAYQYGANRIWIVNVGDLKPMEFPIEFFLDLAWDPQRWPKESIAEFTRLWAEREFGRGACAGDRGDRLEVHEVQRKAQAGAAGAVHVQPDGLPGGRHRGGGVQVHYGESGADLSPLARERAGRILPARSLPDESLARW